MTFTFFDIAILGLMTLSVLLGLYRGALYILVDSTGIILTLFLTLFLAPFIYPYLLPYIYSELLNSIVTYILLYITISLLLTFISARVISCISIFRESSLDSISGGIIGFVRGGIISTIIFTLITIFTTGSYAKSENVGQLITNIDSEKQPSWIKNAMVTPYLAKGLNIFVSIMPEGYLGSISLPSKKDEDDESEEPKQESIKNKITNASQAIEAVTTIIE